MISIIVPVYNCSVSLEYSVRAIQQQTFSDWELILVDDGSTDGSDILCDRFATEDNRIKAIHKQNGGVSSARNIGIDTATGEYITFCDGDDYLEKDYLEILLRTAQDNPDYGHIWCCFQTVTGYKKENAVPNCIVTETISYYTLKDYMTLHEMWLDVGPCNKLYRIDVIRNSNLRFIEDLSLGEDWLFNFAYIDASSNDKIAVVGKPLYNYVRGNDKSLDSKYRDDLLEIYRRLIESCQWHLQKWNVSKQQFEKFFNSRFYLYERVLSNTMRAPNMTNYEKIKCNTKFMHSEEFQEALRTRTCFVHLFYLIAYKSGNYRIVMLVKRLCKIKADFLI